MVERLGHNSPEQEARSSELAPELKKHQEELLRNREAEKNKAERLDSERAAESAKHEALDRAASSEKQADDEKSASKAEKASDRLRHLSPKKREAAAFAMEMKEARSQMSTPGKAFSKVIHSKVIEKPSEAVGATLARPNAMLAGAVFAFVITGALYAWARWAGYPLSGFETIGSFVIGWLIGILFDFTRIMITGKR